jgi:hypothetical protein
MITFYHQNKRRQKNMADENKTSDAGVTPDDSVMGQEEKPKDDAPQTPEEPKDVPVGSENPEQDPDEEKFDEKAKLTLKKIREERDAEVTAKKQLEQKIADLENQFKERDKRDAEAQGNYKQLWETQQKELQDKDRELLTVQQDVKSLQDKLDNEKTTAKQTARELSNTLNQTIDSLMANWPEKAKSFVDPADKVSASVRWAQYKKAEDFVVDFLKEKPSPGLSPSPKDIRDEGKDKEQRPEDVYTGLRRSGIYNV